MIVDAHSHIFPRVQGLIGEGPSHGPGYGRVEVAGRVSQALPPYNAKTEFTPQMLVANMDWAGVDRVILLQGSFYGECDDYVARAVSDFPDRLSGAMYADPWRVDYRQVFEDRFDRLGFAAAKIEFSCKTGLCGLYPQARLDDDGISWLWQALTERGKTLVLDLGTAGERCYQTEAVRTIATSYPTLSIVIAHLGQPRPEVETRPELWQRWCDQIDLGLLSNVWFDTSSLPNYDPDDEYPFATAAHNLHTAIERIGTRKILWGTDQPGLLGTASYPQLMASIRHHTKSLSAADRAAIFGENALTAYGL